MTDCACADTGLASGCQCLHEQCTDFGLEAASDDEHAAVVLVDVNAARLVALLGLARLGMLVHLAPAADDALDVGRGARLADTQQHLFGVRRGHARDGPNLRVGKLAPAERLRQSRQRAEGAGHAHPLARGTRVEAHAPREPRGAGAKAVVPAALSVEVADEREQARSGGLEVRRQLGDLVAKLVELGDPRRGGAKGLSGVDCHSDLLALAKSRKSDCTSQFSR